jgi:acyl-CoA reductase-like NAD-dependent aldehyde dehydrogenase
MSDAVAQARADWQRWRHWSVAGRVRLLRALRLEIVARLDEIVHAVAEPFGKPAVEVLLNDVLPTLELINYYERHAARILRAQRRPATFLFQRARFHVEYQARGVVLVLAPLNLPLQLAFEPIVTAFAAGNAVICKLSEHTPGMVALFSDLFARAGFPPGAVRFETGGPEVGERLVRARPDLVFLTGGSATGKRVMALAAENLTPVILELGGKDPLLVFADAPFERAVAGAVYGAFANAGQICVAAQRVYVQRAIFARFVDAVVGQVEALRLAPTPEADLGSLATDAQAARFEALIDDAVKKGATLHTRHAVTGRRAAPVVLTGVTPAMRILREETFGPAMPIIPFDTEEQAIELANDSAFGLNGSVWTGDLARGARIASRIEAGSVAVNDVMKNIGNPHLPFGGIKGSGMGVYHGPEGLRAFCRPLAVMVNPSRAPREPNWFPYTLGKRGQLETMIAFLYSDASWLERLRLFVKLRAFGFGAEAP